VRGIEVSHGEVEASIRGRHTAHHAARDERPGGGLRASGTLELDGVRSSRIEYTVTRSDLARLKDFLGRDVAGEATTTGTMTGTLDRMRFAGDATIDRLVAADIEAGTNSGSYDVTIPTDNPVQAAGTIKGKHALVKASVKSCSPAD
jgi:hypothetical protein